MSAEESARIGARLRAERKARGLVVADLAERFREVAPEKISQRLPRLKDIERTIRGHEAGDHTVGERYRLLYCRVFDVAEEDLFGPAESPPPPDESASPAGSSLVDLLSLAWTVGRLDQRVDRRAIHHLAAALTAAPALGAGDPVERIASALTRPAGLGEDLVSHLEARSIGFHRLEFVLPAGQIFRGLLAHLSEITSLLEICPKDRLRRRLASVAGEAAVLGAWIAWDLGDTARAGSLYRVAQLAAKEGDDPAIIACSVIYQSLAISGPNGHASARRALAEARQFLPEQGDLATRAWLMGREAEEAAALGDPLGQRLIEEASDTLALSRPQHERTWTRCLESPRLPHMRLSIATHLGDEAAVHDGVGELAILASDPAQKATARVLATMGLALIAIGDVSEGIGFGEQSIEAVRVSQATYAMNRLSELEVALRDQSSVRSRELREGIRATRLELSSPRPSIPGTNLDPR